MRRTFALVCLAALSLSIASASSPTAQQLIDLFKMSLIPQEGAWFAPVYRSPDRSSGAESSRLRGPHSVYTSIYALETKRDFSALHRLTTDEMWHYYGGDPLELLLLFPDGHGETVVLGPDVLAGQRPQILVPRGVWQGSHTMGSAETSYTFFGTTMAPGFEASDYEHGYRDDLIARYPAFASRITALTREDSLHKPRATASDSPVAPPLELQEIVGRTAKDHSERVSVAYFRLQPGAASALSYNHVGEEIFIVTAGHGGIIRGTERIAVASGSVVNVEPSVHRSVRADANEPLEFYAITSPAWSPQDDVHVVQP